MKYRIEPKDENGRRFLVIEFAHVNPYGVEGKWQPLLVLGYQRKFYNMEEAEDFLKRVKGQQ